jgi:hypothetical protein
MSSVQKGLLFEFMNAAAVPDFSDLNGAMGISIAAGMSEALEAAAQALENDIGDPDESDCRGDTALHHIALLHSTTAAGLLPGATWALGAAKAGESPEPPPSVVERYTAALRGGFSPFKKNEKGQTAIELADQHGLLAELVQAMADVSPCTDLDVLLDWQNASGERLRARLVEASPQAHLLLERCTRRWTRRMEPPHLASKVDHRRLALAEDYERLVPHVQTMGEVIGLLGGNIDLSSLVARTPRGHIPQGSFREMDEEHRAELLVRLITSFPNLAVEATDDVSATVAELRTYSELVAHASSLPPDRQVAAFEACIRQALFTCGERSQPYAIDLTLSLLKVLPQEPMLDLMSEVQNERNRRDREIIVPMASRVEGPDDLSNLLSTNDYAELSYRRQALLLMEVFSRTADRVRRIRIDSVRVLSAQSSPCSRRCRGARCSTSWNGSGRKLIPPPIPAARSTCGAI